MAEIFPSSNLQLSYVGMFFGYGFPVSLAAVCRAKDINEWSRYKPVRYPTTNMTKAIRDTLSGFKIDPVTRFLEYDYPTGGISSPYRLGDFLSYNHDAKRPSNTIMELDIYVDNANNIPGKMDFGFNFTLPQHDTVKTFATDLFNDLKGNTIAFRINNNTVPGHIGSGLSIDGKCAAKISDIGINENTTTIFALVKDINIKDYGASTIGSLYRVPIEVWYGDGNNLDFSRFKIPGGDSVTIQGRIRINTILVSYFVLPDISWFPPSNAVRSTSNFTFDPLTGVMSVTNLRWVGDTIQNLTTDGIMKFENFKYNNSFRLQYWVYKEDGTIVRQVKDMFATHPSIINGTSSSVNRQEGTYNVIVSDGFQITGLERGWRVMFQLNPDPI